MKVVEALKSSKREMEIKFDQAKKRLQILRLMNLLSLLSLLLKVPQRRSSKNFFNCNDEAIDFEDKLAMIAAFAEHHDDVDGMAIIGIHRSDLS